MNKIQAKEILGSYLSCTSKMPCYSYNLSALDCIKGSKLVKYSVTKPLIIDPNSNLIFVIKKLSKFVGESIPIVNKKTNEMIGIISENDVLQAYLDISEEINQIEKH